MKYFLGAIFSIIAGATGLIVHTVVNKTPEAAVASALNQLADEQFLGMDFTIDTVAPMPESFGKQFGITSVPLTVRLENDLALGDHPSTVGRITMAVSPFFAEALLPKIDSLLLADGRRFFKISRLGILKKVNVDAAAVNDVWLINNPADLRMLAGLEKSTTEKSAVADSWDTFLKVIVEGELFSVKGKLTGENINGLLARRYDVDINRAALASATIDAIGAMTGLQLNNESRARLRQTINRAQQIRGELWIDHNNANLKRFGVTIVPATQDWNAPITVLIDFRELKNPAGVEAPANARTLNELLLPFLKKKPVAPAPVTTPPK